MSNLPAMTATHPVVAAVTMLAGCLISWLFNRYFGIR